MHSTLIIAAVATAVAAASSDKAIIAGQANILNNCDFPVYVKSVDGISGDKQWASVVEPGHLFSENFRRTNPESNIALKVSPDRSFNQRTELSYTYKPQDDKVWYSLSNIFCQTDDCAFRKNGMSLQTSFKSCSSFTCAPGQGCPARDVYLHGDDHFAVKQCRGAAMLNLLLCSSQQFKSRFTLTTEDEPVVSARNHTARAVYNQLSKN
jgi:hypothetical protein